MTAAPDHGGFVPLEEMSPGHRAEIESNPLLLAEYRQAEESHARQPGSGAAPAEVPEATPLTDAAQVEALREDGGGAFTCPACGTRASDDRPYPYCPGGCSAETMAAAAALRPDPCPDHSENWPGRHCVACKRYTEHRLTEWEISPEALELKARRRLADMEAAEEAKRRYAVARRPPLSPMDWGTLEEMLLRDPPPEARISGLVPWEASTLVIAQRKTGKTTLTLNLVRSLVTGEPFLGRFEVRPVTGRVALLNFEVSGAQATRWADEHGVPRDRFILVNLRGVPNPFGDPEMLARLSAYLRSMEVETVIVDPFGRAFTGESQNDAGQVQSWLMGLDRFARHDVGALDVVLTVHAGWTGGRARGSSALEDWPDSLLYLSKDGSERRKMSADGRDVDMDEEYLEYDESTRTVTVTGSVVEVGAEAPGRDDRVRDMVLATIDAHPSGWAPSESIGDVLRSKHLGTSNLSRTLKPFKDAGVIEWNGKPGKASAYRRPGP